MLLRALELELERSRKRKRIFGKVLKIFKEKMESFLIKNKPIHIFYPDYEFLLEGIKKERSLLKETLIIFTEKLYLKSNFDLVKDLFFEYFNATFWNFEINSTIMLLNYFIYDLNEEEKNISKEVLRLYLLYQINSKCDISQKLNGLIANFNKKDKILVLSVIFKLVYKTALLSLRFLDNDIKDYSLLLPKITKKVIKKREKRKWVLNFLEKIIRSGWDVNLENDFKIEDYIKEKYGKSLEDLKKEYVFDEDNNEPGKIFKKVAKFLYKTARLYPDILEPEGIVISNEYQIFIEYNRGLIYELSLNIFKKRIVGFKIYNLKSLYRILKDEDLKGLSIFKRNLIYKAIDLILFSTYYSRYKVFTNKKIIKKIPKELQGLFKEINKNLLTAKTYYENTINILNKNVPNEKKLFFIYENLNIIEAIINPNLLTLQNYLWVRFMGWYILYLINQRFEKETFNPEESKNLDIFLFGAKIRTKKGKIITGYVEKDLKTWFNYLFSKHKKEKILLFHDENELY